mmetsp:Transcript_19741/g.44823  ORF Transcript_19741/g.44823 Transcript_19741/m.44823 type:complete len:402 (+) Transcript_19741:54-1259(+)
MADERCNDDVVIEDNGKSAIAESSTAEPNNETFDDDFLLAQFLQAEEDSALLQRTAAACDGTTKDHDASYALALKLQEEEEMMLKRRQNHGRQCRVPKDPSDRSRVTVGYVPQASAKVHAPPPRRWGADDAEDFPALVGGEEDEDEYDSGFRLNNNSESKWARHDNNYIVGPNGEKRTKHDIILKGQSNAHRMGLSDETIVGDRAYNSFKNKLKKGMVKGVAAHGTGKAEKIGNIDTRQGALDTSTIELLRKAVNSGFISTLNGSVKEGKEAVVYHANGPDSSLGRGRDDVAVKVFKKIQEFRNRAEYVIGDSRYRNIQFTKKSKQDQLELWTEKEYRNLRRAHAAGVCCPTVIVFKKNILFMKFLGIQGVPWPRLKDISLPQGSKKWTHYYAQTMVAARR